MLLFPSNLHKSSRPGSGPRRTISPNGTPLSLSGVTEKSSDTARQETADASPPHGRSVDRARQHYSNTSRHGLQIRRDEGQDGFVGARTVR